MATSPSAAARTASAAARRLGARTREVQDAGAGTELLGPLDLEALGQAALEVLARVVLVEPLALGREQPLDHRVVEQWELDDQRGAQGLQPVEEGVDRDVPRDHDVMDEGEDEDEVRLAPGLQGPPLEAPPSAIRGGIGERDDEGQDVRAAL